MSDAHEKNPIRDGLRNYSDALNSVYPSTYAGSSGRAAWGRPDGEQSEAEGENVAHVDRPPTPEEIVARANRRGVADVNDA